MNCPLCNAYNPSDASYCTQCRHNLATVDDDAHGGGEEDPSTDPYDQRYTLSNATDQGSAIPVRDLRGLLSATFAIYQENFGVLFRIALLAQVPFFVATLIPSDIMASAVSMAGLLTGLLANAAVTYLVAQRYLGRSSTAANSYAAAISYGGSLLINLGAYVAVIISLSILSLFIIGIPLLVFVVVAWFLYVQAVMVEGKGPGTALTRSWELVKGSWWRVFGVVIVFGLLPSLIIVAINWIAGDLIAVVGGVLVTPIVHVGTVLLYLDLRARKEGYTLEQLASDMSASPDPYASQ